jgi:2'-5' RNA ligase
MKFLGATWPRLLPTVEQAVAATARATPSFRSALTTVGAFPTPTRARVLWAGLDDPNGSLSSIAGTLDERLREDFIPEKRPFTPHLTVARLTPPRNLQEFAPGLDGLPVPSERFVVDRLVLYRSHLSPRGATYEALRSDPLGQ